MDFRAAIVVACARFQYCNNSVHMCWASQRRNLFEQHLGLSCLQILGREEGSEGEGQTKMRNKKNRYGMPKISGRRFRVERMNIFGARITTEFSIDEVRGTLD